MKKSFYFLCRNAMIQAENFLQKEFSDTDLTPAQANLLLIILEDYPYGTTLTELHERIGITKPSLSSLIKPAKQKGYLRVQSLDGDERVKVLLPTDKLRGSAEKLAAAEKSLQNVLRDAIGENRLDQACETLEEICLKGNEYLKKGVCGK